MRRGWLLPDFASDAPRDPDDDLFSDSGGANPSSGWGCDEVSPEGRATSGEDTPGGAPRRRGVFSGLASRLRAFAPTNPEDVAPADESTEINLRRCTREFSLKLHSQHAASKAFSESSETDSDSSEFCRICREGSSREPLITPCDCRGTVRFVHKSCLERWLAESDTSFCEICGLHYVTERSPRYGLLKTIVLWAMSARSDLFFDLLTVLTFVPLAVLGTSMGVSASRSLCYGVLSDGDEEGISNLVLMVEPRMGPVVAQTMTAAVVAVMAAMDIAVSAWLVLRIQQHATRCYAWWRRQCVVRLVHLRPPQQTVSQEPEGSRPATPVVSGHSEELEPLESIALSYSATDSLSRKKISTNEG